MRLYDYWRSTASYRVRIALALKGAAYERVPIDLRLGEQRGDDYLAVNPQGLVPALVTDDGVTLTQSLAIVDWLDGAYPAPRLIPAEQPDRARALAQAMTIAADIHPIDNLRVLKRLERDFGADQAARDDWYRHWIELGLATLEAAAAAASEAAAGGARYLGGAAPGIADVFLIPQLYNARRGGVDLTRYPRLVAIDAAASGLDAFRAAHPDAVNPG